ncbi:hypothetical protein IC582_002696 [Cucumis melo]
MEDQHEEAAYSSGYEMNWNCKVSWCFRLLIKAYFNFEIDDCL